MLLKLPTPSGANLAVPPPQVAKEPDWQAAALDGIKASDELAKDAGMDPAVRIKTERQEWHGN